MCEPLKGKKFMFYECGEDIGIGDIEKLPVQYETLEIFSKEDVKSAVEGLLKSISILKQPCDKDEVYDLVLKWFEDVIE